MNSTITQRTEYTLREGKSLRRVSPVVILAVFLASTSTVRAQSITGTVLGRVMDPSGAMMAGVTVTVTNQTTNASRSTKSARKGHYTFTSLPVGTYALTVSSEGYKTGIVRNLVVTAGSIVRLDLRLKDGPAEGTTEEMSPGPILNASLAQVAHSVEGRMVRELPVAGRDLLRLATLGPGVYQRPTSNVETLQVGEYLGSNIPTIAGGRAESISYSLGGVNINNRRLNTPVEKLALEAVEEFKVLINNYAAEYGQGDGQVLVEFRSGSNRLHGSVYDFLRNDGLNARGFFDDSKARDHYNEFGFAVGGPIVKNRTFFFANYEGTRNAATEIQGALFPTPQMLGGDFSHLRDAAGNLIPIYDPSTTDPITGQRQPFPGNIIPANRISPMATTLYDLYRAPTPSAFVSLGDNNALKALSRKQPVDQFSIKIDHALTSRDALSTRISYAVSNSDNENIIQADSITGTLRSLVLGQAWTHMFNPHLLNELRFGYMRHRDFSVPPAEILTQNLQAAAGISKWLPVNLLPAISFQSETGTSSFHELGQINGDGGSGDLHHSVQFTDNFSWIKGRHLIKFGVDLRRRRWDTMGVQSAGIATLRNTGIFTSQIEPDPVQPGLFRGVLGTGSPVADFLLGGLGGVDFGYGGNIFSYRDSMLRWYYHQTYQVTRRFTVSLGLPFDYLAPPKEKQGRQSFVVAAPICPGGCLVNDGVFGGVFDRITNPFPGKPTVRRGGIKPGYDVGFRISLAYRWGDKTVTRFGVGKFRGLWEQNNFANPTQPPFGSGFYPHDSISDRSNLAQFTQAKFRLDNIYPSLPPPGQAPRGLFVSFLDDLQTRQPSIVNWHGAVQHAFSPHFSLEVGYLGKFGRNLPSLEETNSCTTDPCTFDKEGLPMRSTYYYLGPVIVDANDASNWYHGGYVEVERRFLHGLQFKAAYTWSKNISTGFDSQGNDAFLGSAYIGPLVDSKVQPKKLSVLDVPQRFVISGIYELPFGKGKQYGDRVSGPLHRALGGWQLNWITAFQSGPVVDLTSFGLARFKPSRENELQQLDFRKSGFFFDPGLFQLGAGDSIPFNNFRGRGINNWDISIFKNIPVTETQRVQFRAEFLNAWNHTQFEIPGHVIFLPEFGKFQATNPGFYEKGVRAPRTIQLALKYIF